MLVKKRLDFLLRRLVKMRGSRLPHLGDLISKAFGMRYVPQLDFCFRF